MTNHHYLIRRLDRFRDLSTLHRHRPDKYPFLLVSSARLLDNATGRPQARYDILFACPQQQLLLNHDFALEGVAQYHHGNDFLRSLNNWFTALRTPAQSSELPFTGGWFFYLAYELAQQIEPALLLPGLENEEMAACAVRIPAAIIIDHERQSACLVVEKDYAALLDSIEQDYNSLPESPPRAVAFTHCKEADAEPYLQQVARIKQYIVDGDIFQANLSRQWQCRLASEVSDADIFHALAHANPASFAALARFDNFSIISSSPERLVSVQGDTVETRPIAGTRPRHDDHTLDTRLSRELLAHPKEQAEHIMLIDLERNDLGRICRPGSIHVNELLTLESWQHVHHIVSNIRGRLQTDVLPGDVLRAVFPGGTITGCPKVRCMQILAEQEQQPRGAYTGTLGYINRDGNLDSNILIRSLVRHGRQIRFRAGGGIVADSEPMAELVETRAKAAGLLRAGGLHADTNNEPAA